MHVYAPATLQVVRKLYAILHESEQAIQCDLLAMCGETHTSMLYFITGQVCCHVSFMRGWTIMKQRIVEPQLSGC